MQIYLIYNNQKFRFEYNNKENPQLQVKFIFSKLPKKDLTHEEKEFIVIWEDEVFTKEDYIDMQKYNNKEFVFIFPKRNNFKKSLNEEEQTTKELEKKENNNINNANLTMAQMIKILTNAKEEIKIRPRTNDNQNQNSSNPSSFRRFMIDPSILEEYDVDSDYDYQDDYEEDYESDVIMANEDSISQMPPDESDYSASDMDFSMTGNNFEINEDHLSQLVAMGFNPELSALALRRCNNRIDLAVEFLMFI